MTPDTVKYSFMTVYLFLTKNHILKINIIFSAYSIFVILFVIYKF